MNIFELKKVITEFSNKHPAYILKESESEYKHTNHRYRCVLEEVITDFCFTGISILQEENNKIRIIVNVTSRDRYWRAFEEYSTEWNVQELTVEKIETCLRNYGLILHNVRCEEQHIQKAFKVSLRKNKIFKDSFEEIV